MNSEKSKSKSREKEEKDGNRLVLSIEFILPHLICHASIERTILPNPLHFHCVSLLHKIYII